MNAEPNDMTKPWHLRKDTDLSGLELERLLTLAAQEKRERGHRRTQPLARRTVALLFEKPSTRTRAAFEVAAYGLGAHCTYLDPASSHLGDSESVEDTAQVLGRSYDAIAFRGYSQESVETLAAHAGVPVWNALTDTWHPTQALADLLTVQEHVGREHPPARVCFVGDGNDNVVQSLLVSGAARGLDVRVACPAPSRRTRRSWTKPGDAPSPPAAGCSSRRTSTKRCAGPTSSMRTSG